MKKQILFLLLLFVIGNGLATDWFPVGAKWYWGHVQECCGPPPRPDFYSTWEVLRDTVIQGKTCSIVEKINGSLTKEFIFHAENNIVTRYSPVSNNFLPAYDFNKNAGDTTLVLTDSGTIACDTLLFVIDSILPLKEDTLLKVQFGKILSNINCTFSILSENISVIEKIGFPSLDLNNYFFITDRGTDYIRCYNDSITDIHFVSYACDTTITAVQEKLNSQIPVKLFPNPASDRIQIEYSSMKSKEIKVILLNMEGRVVKESDDLSPLNISLQVSDVDNGLYYLKVVMDNEFIVKPFIIHH